MLKAKKQRDAFNTTWENLSDHLWCFYYDRDPRSVHQARVATKRLKAQLLLFQAQGDASDLPPAFGKVQKIFKHLGRIRSAQIHLTRLEGHGMATSEHGRKVRYTQTIETKRFADHYSAYAKDLKKAHADLEAGFSNLDLSLLETFLRKEMRVVERFFRKTYKDADQLHDIRKRIKNLLFIHPVLPKMLRNKLRMNTDYLDELQEAIGKWHDAHDVTEALRNMEYDNEQLMNELLDLRHVQRDEVYALSADFALKATMVEDHAMHP